MSRSLRLLIAAIGLFLAACTSEGVPNSFADQGGRVERQFVSSCEAAQEGEEDATAFCECAFYTAASELGFEGFLELDELLREDPTNLPFENLEMFDNVSLPCDLSADDVPAAVTSEE